MLRHQVAELNLGVRDQGAYAQRVALHANSSQGFNARDVNHPLRLRQTHVQGGHERLASSEQAGVIAMRLQQPDNLAYRFWLDIVKRGGFHRDALSRSQQFKNPAENLSIRQSP